MPAIDMGWFWLGIWEAAVALVKYVLWWLLPLAMLKPCCELVLRHIEQERDLRLGLTDIDQMDGARFEDWLASFFRARGYRVETTPRAGDYGVDLILEKNGHKTVVQAKRWKGSVGVTAIQEVYAGKTLYGADAAMVVTNSRFTDDARRLAKSTGVVLWDRNRLRAELENQAKHPATKASLAS
ncbi:MAG TPA: restriction endonuclease [Firmicutes bacterium]|nr:restriction endonuclease [Candidatus Fermentithermobacillaceae bacterium]